jgi:hypothetical protein
VYIIQPLLFLDEEIFKRDGELQDSPLGVDRGKNTRQMKAVKERVLGKASATKRSPKSEISWDPTSPHLNLTKGDPPLGNPSSVKGDLLDLETHHKGDRTLLIKLLLCF